MLSIASLLVWRDPALASASIITMLTFVVRVIGVTGGRCKETLGTSFNLTGFALAGRPIAIPT
jgi:hypothetical protein